MFACMAVGRSEIHAPLLGADCLATIECFQKLGVRIDVRPDLVVVESKGWKQWQPAEEPLDFGNSGTTARLLLGVFAATPGLEFTLHGDKSLSTRPMLRVVNPLRQMDAQITGEENGNFLPLQVSGAALTAREHSLDKASAQIKSALLLAGMNCQGTTSISLPAGARDHTEKFLAAQGAEISIRLEAGREVVTLKGPFAPRPFTCTIPGDPSSAAFFAVHAALSKSGSLTLERVLDNATRTGFLSVLRSMSAGVTCRSNTGDFLEPVMDLTIDAGVPLKGTEVPAEFIPTLVDEVPILAVAAAFAEGPSRFCGLAELRVKESDRLAATLELLNISGAGARIEGDDLWVAGGLTESRSFKFDPRGDHRLAMAAAVLAKRAVNPCTILDSQCVSVSMPAFFDLLDHLG